MNYSLNLSASILGTISSIALVQPAALALTASQIDQIAEAVTVRIDTPGSSGSGVIIQREGNIYTVLTARHVIDSIRGNEEAYVIPASDERQSYRINNRSIQALPNNVDLAIFQFQSSATYQTATLGNSDAMNRGENSYVSGYPLLTAALNQPLRQFTQGNITANATQPLDDGYGIVYSNDTLPGMSGGPVFNSQGEVVGIHGRGDIDQTQATGNSGVVVKTGFNLAVPINTFRRWNEQNRFLAVNTSEAVPAQRVETNETQASNFFLQGGEQLEAGNYRQAIALYDQAIRINPDEADAYNDRGVAKAILGNYQEAIADYNQAIRINPNLALPYYNRGVAKQGLGDQQK